VILLADPRLTTLLDFHFQPRHFAANGQPGEGSDCNGLSAENLTLHLPVGTVVKDAETGELLTDLATPDETFVVARGGKGGLGNMNFANATRQAPRFAQPGVPGEEKHLTLELKLLADVGLIGFPNAGKSTFVSRVSRARPKVADYPFTTLVPHLGVVGYKDQQSFVIADIPGLIEGAHLGVGLGHQFLRHVERCRVLIHLIDCGADEPGREPLADFDTLNEELRLHSADLALKPQIVAANKMDLPDARERLEDLRAALTARSIPVFPISSATGEGIPAVIDAAAQILFTRP
jgi:GTP-binding protein